MDVSNYNKLTDISLDNSSQLNMFSILRDIETNEYYLNIFRSYVLNESALNEGSFFTLYEVGNHEFLDQIAYDVYGVSEFWWIIALINNIVNPYEEIYQGMVLKILKYDYLYNIVKEIKAIGNK